MHIRFCYWPLPIKQLLISSHTQIRQYYDKYSIKIETVQFCHCIGAFCRRATLRNESLTEPSSTGSSSFDECLTQTISRSASFSFSFLSYVANTEHSSAVIISFLFNGFKCLGYPLRRSTALESSLIIPVAGRFLPPWLDNH